LGNPLAVSIGYNQLWGVNDNLARDVIMSQPDAYVRADEHGVLRVGATRVMLDSVIAAFQQGHSAETIRQQYPALSLEQVYGSVTYYLAHRDEVEAYLQRQDGVWQEWQARCEKRPSPVIDRLRALRSAGVPEAS
jgi:uncharacterized protein (DUF433 family)